MKGEGEREPADVFNCLLTASNRVGVDACRGTLKPLFVIPTSKYGCTPRPLRIQVFRTGGRIGGLPAVTNQEKEGRGTR